MADIDKKDEKEVTSPLSVKKPEVAGEEDQTVKIEKPVKPAKKPVVNLDKKADDAVPLKPKDEEDEEKTAKLPKLPKPGVKKPEVAGEEDQTVKIEKPVKPAKKPVVNLDKKADDAVPLKPKDEEDEEKTAKLPKLPKPGAEKLEAAAKKEEVDEDLEATIDMDKDEVAPLKKAAAGEEDQTAKIPKPQKDDKKVVLNSATDSAIRPSDATTMAPAVVPENIDMRKTESGNVEVDDGLTVPEPAVAKKPDAGGASATPAPTATPAGQSKGRKTIKLKPLKKDAPPPEEENAEETLSMDRSALMKDEANMPSLGGAAPTKEAAAAPSDDDGNLEDEATVKIQKPEMTKPAHPTPAAVPGSKETIKLRPSTTPPPPGAAGVTKTEPAADADDAAVSKKTIRLVPKKPGDDDSTQKTPKAVATSGAAKPSAPTVKLQEPDDVTQKTARPSAPTVKMPEPGAAAAVPPPAAGGDKPSASKKTLKLKATSPAAPSPQETRGPDGKGMPPADAPAGGPAGGAAPAPTAAAADKGADPGIVLTLVAVLTLMCVAYYVWMVAGQWAEQYQGIQNCNVPALSGKVKRQ